MDGGAKRNRRILQRGEKKYQCLPLAPGSLSSLTVSCNINMSEQRSRAYHAACNNRQRLGLLRSTGRRRAVTQNIPPSHPVAYIHSQVDLRHPNPSPVAMSDLVCVTTAAATIFLSFLSSTVSYHCHGNAIKHLIHKKTTVIEVWVYNAAIGNSSFLQVLFNQPQRLYIFPHLVGFLHVVTHYRVFFFHLIQCSVGRREKDTSYPPTVYSNTRAQLCSFPSSASRL